MANSFQELFDDNKKRLPDDLEGMILHDMRGVHTVSSLVSHFLPGAFQTAARLFAGDHRPDPFGPANHLTDDEDIPLWRVPPDRGR
jgi:hypothetical protein